MTIERSFKDSPAWGYLPQGASLYNELKNEIINGLMPFLSNKTGRVPIILPIIMNIKKEKKK